MPSPPGPPMTLGNMRSLGVRSLFVTCELCHHEAVLSAERLERRCARCDDFRPRMVCTQLRDRRRRRPAEPGGRCGRSGNWRTGTATHLASSGLAAPCPRSAVNLGLTINLLRFGRSPVLGPASNHSRRAFLFAKQKAARRRPLPTYRRAAGRGNPLGPRGRGKLLHD